MRRFLLSFILICLLAVPVSAHSGKTDSSGGHTDSDTGEYHYHHGYPAHDHYDMDGDGDLDCPYNFVDKSGQNSGSSSSSSSTTRTSASTTSADYQRGYDDGHDDGYAEGKKYVAITSDRRYEEGLEEGRTDGYADGYTAGFSKARTLAFWAAGLVSAFFLLMGSRRKKRHEEAIGELRIERSRLVLAHDREIGGLKAGHEQQVAALRGELDRAHTRYQGRIQQLIRERNAQISNAVSQERAIADAEIESLASILKNALGSDWLLILAGAPEGAYVGDDGLPVETPTLFSPWGRDYTFYVNMPTDYSARQPAIRYHTSSCQHGRVPTNAGKLWRNAGYAPCKLCKPVLPDLEWYSRYQDLKSIFDNRCKPQEQG